MEPFLRHELGVEPALKRVSEVKNQFRLVTERPAYSPRRIEPDIKHTEPYLRYIRVAHRAPLDKPLGSKGILVCPCFEHLLDYGGASSLGLYFVYGIQCVEKDSR